VVDALESKRHDLGADLAVIFSNSGFAKAALRKATRVGIDCASALMAGDKRVRVTLERDFVAKGLSLEAWSPNSFFPRDAASPETFDTRDLTRNGLPVVNWIHKVSGELLKEYEDATQIVATYAFQEPTAFAVSGVPIIGEATRAAALRQRLRSPLRP